MLRAALVASLLATVPNCPDLYSVATHGFSVPKLHASAASAASTGGQVTVQIELTADNPNPYPLTLRSLDFDVAVDGNAAFSGTETGATVAEHGSGKLVLHGSVSTASAAVRGLRPGAISRYALTGTAHCETPAGISLDVEFQTGGPFVVPRAM